MTSAEVDNNEGGASTDAVAKIDGDNANAVEVETPTSTSDEGNSEALPTPEVEQTSLKPDEASPTIDEAAPRSPNQSVEVASQAESTSPPAATDIGQLASPSTEQCDEAQFQHEPVLDAVPVADPGAAETADCNDVSEVAHQDESSASGTPDGPAAAAAQEVLPSEPAEELDGVKVVVESSEAAAVLANENQVRSVEKPESPADPSASVGANTEQQPTTEEAGSQDETPAPEDVDSVEPVEAELSSQQSSASLPAKPSGFLDSLTAEFAADTKAAWAQIFGPRYEEGYEDADSQADNQSVADSTAASVSSRISFKAKLARERKLDEQIQASQRRYRERVLRDTAVSNAATKRDRTKASRRPQTQIPILSPFERAGFSLTQVRFCTEKALDETCKFFRHLYATAMEEPEEPGNPPTQGVYITQGELEILLRELFDPHEPASSSSNTRRGTVAGPLGFTNTHDAGPAEGIPMNTQLQASWFIPFGQLPQLRSLVMKITKRHLNEDKLAIVNRHLQKQLTLLPLSSKVQDLVVQLSNYQMKEPPDVPLKQRLRSSVDLAQDLLTCIAVNEVMSTERQAEDYQNFLLFLPVELVAKTQLSSVVCAQRLVFFRFLIDIIAAERSRLHSQSTESLPRVISDRTSSSTQVKRKTMVKRRSSSKSTTKRDSGSDDTPQDPAEPTDNPPGGEEVTSIHAAHGSVPSTSEAEVNEPSGETIDPFESPIEQAGDECEKPASQLQQQLEAAITQLRQTLPTIDSELDQDAKIYAVNPAIRATYLAAVACQQSVLIMLDNNIDVDSAMSDKLRHFVEALTAIQLQSGDQVYITQTLPPSRDDQVNDPPQDAPKFPPPYPESSVPEENDDQSESGTVQTQFPPPYAMTAPSYWTFAPSIPKPKSSIAKLASKSPSNKSHATADLRSHFMSRDLPGVGAYNIQRGEKLTFEQRPSYSFGPTGETPSKVQAAPRSDANASVSNGSARKPSARPTLRQRMKSSLAFAPPMLRPPEEEEGQGEDHESVRVHVASQCDDSHLHTSRSEDLLSDLPPHYGAGDAHEAPDERSDGGDLQDLNAETEMDRALRLQQQLFMSEFVQQVVSNQDSPSHFVPRVKPGSDNNQRSRSRSKPYWATSAVSPGIEKLLQRQRRAPSASKSRPTSASTKPVHQPRSSRAPVATSTKPLLQPRSSRVTQRKPPPSPPPRRQLDNDQHLAWAARISELYRPTVEQ